MTKQAYHAIRAAQNRPFWGDYSARKYASRFSTPSLYRLARQLELTRKSPQLDIIGNTYVTVPAFLRKQVV